MTGSKIESAKKLLANGIVPTDMAKTLSVSVRTLYRWFPDLRNRKQSESMVEIIIRDYCPDDLAALIDLFRGSIRSVARRDYSERQVLAWAPDFIDSEDFAVRRIAKPTWVAE